MNSRVVVPDHYHRSFNNTKGTVVGIAAMTIVFSYIVLLDEPIETEFGETKAIVVPGPELNGEDGSNWRLES